MATPRRILVVSNYYSEKMAGIELVAHNLVMRFRAAGDEVRWIASDLRDRPHVCSPGDHPLRAWNFTEEKLGFPYPLPFPRDLHTIKEHVKWCDVVHLHDCLYLSNQFTFWNARRLQKPVVTTQHVGCVPYRQSYKNLLQHLSYRTVGKALLERSHRVTFVSGLVKRWFELMIRFRHPPQVIPNGVDTTIFHPLAEEERMAFRRSVDSENKPLLLFVGRFTEKKGLHLIGEVATAKPEWQWLLVGKTGDVNPHAWNLPNVRVVAPQAQSELRKLYSSADLLVLPSVGEGFPLVVPEAMACGTPVLVAEETAQAVPGLSGNVYGTALDARSLQRTLTQILAEPKELKNCRDRASAFARQVFDWDQIAMEYQALFAETLHIG